MNAPESNGTYLTDATPAQLEEAVALNHLELFALNALAAGGEVRRDGDVTFSYAGPDGEGVIAFPRLPDDRAGERLDEIVAFYLERRPERLVGCWSLAPPRPPDLGVRLLARGFQPGWRPCWMALDLNRMNENHPRPEGLVIEADEAMAVWGVKGLPYSEDRDVGTARETARNHPGRFRHFVAKEGSRVVGHSTALLTHGPLGVAGIYDVGVIEEARNRGVGKAVTLAACRWARERGCRYAVLNATGRRMYEQAGFEWIGDGWTWWLNVPRLAENPPTPERIALAEAVGRGDLDALAAMERRISAAELNQPLTCGMSLPRLAADHHQPESAEWLLSHGADPDLLTAWDLGWVDRVSQILQKNPALVNQRSGDGRTTPLHDAVERNDAELVRLLLSFHPDLEIKDGAYHSTPLGWAEHFGRVELAELIRHHAEEWKR